MKAVIFPGQGSQKVGMGQFYYNQFQTARRLFEEASDELKIDFKKLCFEGPESQLILTEHAQPAILLVSCAGWFCLSEEMSVSSIRYCAGHSVGEYSALVAANILSFREALKSVQQRAYFMNRACPIGQGGMLALIGPSSQEAIHFCKWVEQTLSPLEPANFNTSEQTVLSGKIEAVKWAKENYKQYPLFNKPPRLVPLKVSGPFHSSLMRSAAEHMQLTLEDFNFKKPQLFLIQNATAQREQNINNIKNNLVKQIPSPVLWYQSMEYLIKQGCQNFLELGEGKILAGLMKKINSSTSVSHFHSIDDIQNLKREI